ncbi:MAG: hypothetical protein R3E99_18920 [Burkholderiaceae bacterium]
MNALAGKLTSTTLRANGMGAEGGFDGFMGGLVATSLAGGVISEIQGGKFEDGAKIGAQGYLYNEANKTIEEVGKKLWATRNFAKDIKEGHKDGFSQGEILRERHDRESLEVTETQYRVLRFSHPFEYHMGRPEAVTGPTPWPSFGYVFGAWNGYSDGYNRREYNEALK